MKYLPNCVKTCRHFQNWIASDDLFFVLSRVHSLHFRRFCNAMQCMHCIRMYEPDCMSCPAFLSFFIVQTWACFDIPMSCLTMHCARMHFLACMLRSALSASYVMSFYGFYVLSQASILCHVPTLLLYLTIHCILISCPHHLSCIVLWYTYAEPAMIDWIA